MIGDDGVDLTMRMIICGGCCSLHGKMKKQGDCFRGGCWNLLRGDGDAKMNFASGYLGYSFRAHVDS